MRKANIIAVSTTTAFYMMCGFFGYAAFGNDAPGNLLTGFGFYEPFWLVDLANACIVLHLVGAYQVRKALFQIHSFTELSGLHFVCILNNICCLIETY